MKTKLLLSVASFAILLNSSSAQQVHRCGTMEHTTWLEQQNPAYAQKRLELKQQVEKWVVKNPGYANQRATINIPCVVHVVYKAASENISDAQIQSQIDALNEDFSRTNADKTNTPTAFQNVATAPMFHFCLATIDPNGNITTGIERKSTTVASFIDDDKVKHASQGGMDAWNTSKYFNIWSCNLGGGLLGYAEFPTSSQSSTYGVVIGCTNFGRVGNVASPYDKGRTATHEIGHCFNLSHIWGDSNCGNDQINDTPTQQAANYGCPAFPHKTCGNTANGDMFMNYMDYTDDNCMNMFTQGQSAVIQAVVNSAPYNSLTTSTVCGATASIAVDAGISTVISPQGNSCTNAVSAIVTLKNFGTSALTSVTINYKYDAGAFQTYNWTGNLASNNSVNVTLPATTLSPGNHTFTVNTSSPNTSVDGNTGNDASSSSLVIATGGQALPFSESFENTFPATGWSIINPDNATTWSQTATAAKTGTKSVMVDNYNYNAHGLQDGLMLPAVNLSSSASPSLTFQLAYKMYTNPIQYSDTLDVQISTDCGNTFTSIYRKAGSALATGTPNYVASQFVPVSTDWRMETISLNAYVNEANAIFKFINITDYENELYLDDIQIKSAVVTGITSFEDAGISIFPNPAKNELRVSFSEQNNHSIKIMNITGQQILFNSGTEPEMKLDVSALSQGVYFVEIKSNTSSYMKKIIIE